jgi:glyoxylase-like metal-dependent hydrolase (beta-lactamase superfamily II)
VPLTFQVADLTIHQILEFTAPFMPARAMLPDLTPAVLEENRPWLSPDSLNPADEFILAYQAYIVRTPDHVVLVDTCVGNDKDRPRPEWHHRSGQRFMRELAAAGLREQDIDIVLCTHFHADHVGWNTRLVNGRWVPTFPNARYVVNPAEVDAAAAKDAAEGFPPYADSILPVIEAGQAEIAAGDFSLGHYIRALPTPGHTDGHAAYCFGKGRDQVVMSGDMFHVPLQTRFPALSFARDNDPVLAADTRRSFFERYCDTGTVICTGHFPAPGVGRISRWDGGFRLAHAPGPLPRVSRPRLPEGQA